MAGAAACSGGSTQSLKDGGSTGVTHHVSEADTGATVHARVGDQIAVTLHSTYWQLDAPTSGVLVMAGPTGIMTGGPSCPTVPGTGCGSVRADFRVARSGTTMLTANRQSCGEAMRCTGTQGRWAVTVVATG